MTRAEDGSSLSVLLMSLLFTDVTPPTVNCPDYDYEQRGSFDGENGTFLPQQVQASDANGIAQVTYSIRNGTSLRLGVSHRVIVKATDMHGNSANCTYMHRILGKSCL